MPVPYHHSNLQSEEVIYYVDGQFGSRAGVGAGALTLHPSGLPHGPQPGRVEASLGATHTDELAVMCDTFRAAAARRRSRATSTTPSYALSWHAGRGPRWADAPARPAALRGVRVDAPSADTALCASSSPRREERTQLGGGLVAALEHVAPRERRGGASVGGGCCRSRSPSGCAWKR